MESAYKPSLALTIIGTIFIGLASLVAIWISYDIVSRRGWQTMMTVMIPVYILNALYLAPITLWTYLNYGRPIKPPNKARNVQSEKEETGEASKANAQNGESLDKEGIHSQHDMSGHEPMHMQHDIQPNHIVAGHHIGNHDDMSSQEPMDHMPRGNHTNIHAGHDMSNMNHMNHSAMHNMHMPSPDQPMFPTVTIAVCHCGAGCLLGDIVGEWLVYGTNVMINGRSIWAEFLLDYAFALLFGIFFQYFAIAPMSGDYGPKTLWRATKADFLSLTFFEIGLFGWMAIFQLAIFDSKLEMNNVTYWWMMQIGMFFGHWTAFPINWWLITSGVKERTS